MNLMKKNEDEYKKEGIVMKNELFILTFVIKI